MDLIEACKRTDKKLISFIIDNTDDSSIQDGARAGRYDTPRYAECLSTLNPEYVPHQYSEKPTMLQL